jgi:hypothetical protein
MKIPRRALCETPVDINVAKADKERIKPTAATIRLLLNSSPPMLQVPGM